MMCYASRTGTKRNLAALRAAGWGLLCCPAPASAQRTEGFDRIVLDNGKWRATSLGEPWNADEFIRFAWRLGPQADWLAVPDVPFQGAESLALSRQWLPALYGACRLLLIIVQDGMAPADVEDLVGPDVGIFLGGSTDWKLATLQLWGEWCALRGIYFHVGRVNTIRRIRRCAAAGAWSVDGSSGSRFAINIPKLDAAVRQADLCSPRRIAA